MGKSKPTTIREVARLARVSPATVSRMINGSDHVSSETGERILAAIEKTGYKPVKRGWSLKREEAGLVGLLIPYYDKRLYCDLAVAIADRLRVFGYGLILCVSQDDAAIEHAYLGVLREKGVDGIIYSHAGHGSNSELVRKMATEGVPIVELVRRRQEDLLDAVVIDDAGGAYLMTNYLIGRGHRRIALVGGSPDLWPRQHRLEGYTRALTHAGLSVDPELIRSGPHSLEQAAEVTEGLLDLPDPPTAIFSISVRALLGALDAIRRRGLRIPDDVSISTFEDLDWLAVHTPPITSISVPVQGLANAAFGLLEDRIVHPDSQRKPDCLFLSTHLYERQSCSDLRGIQRLAVHGTRMDYAHVGDTDADSER